MMAKEKTISPIDIIMSFNKAVNDKDSFFDLQIRLHDLYSRITILQDEMYRAGEMSDGGRELMYKTDFCRKECTLIQDRIVGNLYREAYRRSGGTEPWNG